jgi:methionyl-tRNA formyltransferase
MKKEDGAIDWNSTALEIQNRCAVSSLFPVHTHNIKIEKLTI